MIMPNELRPMSRRGIDPVGTCGICGAEGPLSRTHVPPQCAGNGGESVRAAVLVTRRDKRGSERLGAGRERKGGANGYFLCEACNNKAGRFDDAFGQFWSSLAHDLLLIGPMPTTRGPHPAITPPMRPGAIVRSVLAGVMALCPSVREKYPELVDAVRMAKVVEAPLALHLLLMLYGGPERWVSGGAYERVRREGPSVYAYCAFQ